MPAWSAFMTPTVVIVDDSNTIRMLLKMELAKHGFQIVAEAASGAKIFPLYEQHRPTLMMLDIILPDMDGVTAAQAVLQKYPEAMIAMCSSLTARDKVLAARAAGVKHFILKPFSADRIALMANMVLNRVALPAPMAVNS